MRIEGIHDGFRRVPFSRPTQPGSGSAMISMAPRSAAISRSCPCTAAKLARSCPSRVKTRKASDRPNVSFRQQLRTYHRTSLGLQCARTGREQMQQNKLLDHLVGRLQEWFRDGEAKRLRGLEVDDQLEFGR